MVQTADVYAGMEKVGSGPGSAFVCPCGERAVAARGKARSHAGTCGVLARIRAEQGIEVIETPVRPRAARTAAPAAPDGSAFSFMQKRAGARYWCPGCGDEVSAARGAARRHADDCELLAYVLPELRGRRVRAAREAERREQERELAARREDEARRQRQQRLREAERAAPERFVVSPLPVPAAARRPSGLAVGPEGRARYLVLDLRDDSDGYAVALEYVRRVRERDQAFAAGVALQLAAVKDAAAGEAVVADA